MGMKLIMTLLVRNEEDIIRENILYHLNNGVDKLIVTDNNSKDGTLDILKEFEKKGLIDLIYEYEDNYSQWKWVTRMAELAMEKYNPDWLIHSDADEFWWPGEGDLKTVLATVPDEFLVVKVPRNDFIPRPETEGELFNRMIIKDLKSLNHIGIPLPPKICHRPIDKVIIAQGNHKLTYPQNLPSYETPLLEIMHFPMRSYIQFENKIGYGGAALERNQQLSKSLQIGWRNLYEEYKKGTLSNYYYSKILSTDMVEMAFAEGRFCYDTSLRDFLKEKEILN
jgi:hypothetical protein